MQKGLFFIANEDNPNPKVANKDLRIDEKIEGLGVGESVCFPVSKKGSVTGRVAAFNKKYSGEKAWHTKTDRVEFSIYVIRDK